MLLGTKVRYFGRFEEKKRKKIKLNCTFSTDEHHARSGFVLGTNIFKIQSIRLHEVSAGHKLSCSKAKAKEQPDTTDG